MTIMHVETEQDLAYHMLVELLAHQFAYPVRWIETQDVLLGDHGVERLIEVGPSNTLTVMAKRTIDLKYWDHDTSFAIQRKLLCCKSHEKEIYYDIAVTVAEGAPELEPGAEEASQEEQEYRPVKSSDIGHGKASGLTKPVDDKPVTATEVLIALVSQTMKKDISNGATSSIKNIVGGRSALENEIIGDLLSEFGTMPDRAEELKLSQLGDMLQAQGYAGRLGKQSTAGIERLMSSKMPGGYTITHARKFLLTQFGFGTGRQESILVSAMLNPPSSRLGTTEAADEFFSNLGKRFAAAAGITISSHAVSASASKVEIDPAALEALTKDSRQLSKKKLELYAKHLNIDLRAGAKANELSQALVKTLQSQLDLWSNEHGDAYASGIKPMMDARKVRTYDCAWNWVMQDLMILFFDLVRGKVEFGDTTLVPRCLSIQNRATKKVFEVLRYLIDYCHHQTSSSHKTAENVLRVLLRDCENAFSTRPVFRFLEPSTAPRTSIDSDGRMRVFEVPRPAGETSRNMLRDGEPCTENVHLPRIKRKDAQGWGYDADLTKVYQCSLREISRTGMPIRKNVLLTGAGPGSIGAEILRHILSGGANVVVTTSRYSTETAAFYQKMYMAYGSPSSSLHMVPFNQGSQQDVESLLTYIYDTEKGLGWDLDVVLPFAAIREDGREIDTIDSKSELAHRIMLTNALRLLGAIKRHKQANGSDKRPAHIILPLSANHGTFGNDGLYAESKMGLESLFNKWHSESWSAYLTICGASIGWTRGTNLMAGNDVVAAEIEKLGVRTFSGGEMATYIVGLMSPSIVAACQREPLHADLNGGLDVIPNLTTVLQDIREEIYATSSLRRAIADDEKEDAAALGEDQSRATPEEKTVERLAMLDLGFPSLPDFQDELLPLSDKLKNMVDLERAVVITGFAELGPWGNSRTRWEMEARGTFSLEGCVEMAWIMGMIKHVNQPSKPYTGWIDTKTSEPVPEREIKARYEKQILKHSGIRIIEPALWGGYDPHKKQILQEVVIQEDMEPFEASHDTAQSFKREHGDNADVWHDAASDSYRVCIKKGATLMIPKAVDFSNDVAGQIPSGWDPRTYGIGEDIISQVDPITLYTIICTMEALLSSGIVDPYEIYKYIHTSELGNCIGTGIGGAVSLTKMHKSRNLDKVVQKDILQESFVNTMAAWVNMLIFSANGPIRTPVGACATSIESLDSAHDLITSGKAKMCLVGGVDDLDEDVSFEFANMKATSNAEDERAKGRSPEEMSRPTASSRKGFMESQGAGIQIVTTAKLALDMGLPIYAVVALTGMAGDKVSRSVPAPGKGVVVNARETPGAFVSPLYDIMYRRRQLENRRAQIKEMKEAELVFLGQEIASMMSQDPDFDSVAYQKYRTQHIRLETQRQEEDALNMFGNHFWRNHPEISPIRGSLAVWGLTVDDLNVASFHGTSTVMNEKNECDILQRQLSHLGRKPGNKILGVFQKSLTGHPKGAAGAWMLNGCLQILQTGLVPGNRNADNVDEYLEQFSHITYPNANIQTDGIKAFSVTSFGFGQKGGQMIGVHPKYLFATLDEELFNGYSKKVLARQEAATAHFNKALVTNMLFVAKEASPFAGEEEIAAMLDPLARVAKVDDELAQFTDDSD